MASILKIDVLQERYANTGILLSGQINGPLGEIITREGRLKLPNEFAANSLNIANAFAANTITANLYSGITLNMIENVAATANANQVLTADGTGSFFFADAATELKELTDVNSTATANQVLTADGTGNFFFADAATELKELTDVDPTATANQVLTADGTGSFFFAAASDPITVQKTNTTNAILSTVTNVNDFRFDEDSGFDIVDLGSGAVKIQMNSTFKTWKVDGQDDLVATGLDTIELVAGDGITLTTNANGSPYKTITFTGPNVIDGNQKLITASDNFAAGDIVIYDNGSYVKPLLSSSGLSSPVTESNGLSVSGTAATIIYDQVNDRYAVFRRNGSALFAVVAQATSTGFTFGTELQFHNASMNDCALAIDKNTNKIICAWVGGGASYADGGLRVAAFEIDPATNTITVGNVATDLDNPNVGYISIGYDTDSGKFLVIYGAYQDMRCNAGYVDGQNIVLGTRQSLTASGGPTWTGVAYDQTAQRFFVGHNANGRVAAVAQINSDNSITFGAFTTIPNNNNPGYPYYKKSEGKVYLPYVSTSFAAALGEVTIDNVTNTLTFNTLTVATNPSGTISAELAYSELYDQFYFYYRNFDSTEYITDVVFNNGIPSLVNTTVIANMFNFSYATQYKNAVGSDRVVGIYGVGPAYLVSCTFTSINSNISSWIGIAAENINSGDNGKIDLPGTVNSNQNGLVRNSIYYITESGLLTTTPTDYGIVGKALSSTEIQIFAETSITKLVDVNSTATANQVLTAFGNGSFYFADAATELKELTDVNPIATANQVLTADGSGNFFFANNAAAEITTLTDIGIVDGEADQVLTTDGNGSFFFGHTLSILNQDLISGGEITELRDCRTVIDLGTVDTRLGYAAPEGSKTVLLANDSTIVSSSSVSIISEENSIVKLNNIHLLSDVNFDAIANNSISGNKIYGGTISTSAAVFEGSSANAIVRITQTGTGNALVVEDSANPDSTPFVVNASGNVGIKTSSPSATLHVHSQSTTAPSLTFGATSGQIFQNENSELAIGLSNSSPFPLYIQGRTNLNAARDIVINPLGGKVGIGTSSPAANLDIKGSQLGGTAGDSEDVFRIYNPDVNNTTTYRFHNYRYTNGTSHSSSELRLQRKVDVTEQGYVGLRDLAVTFGYGTTERMRIDSSGRVTMQYQPVVVCQATYPGSSSITIASNSIVSSYFNLSTTGSSSCTNMYNNAGRFTIPETGNYIFSFSLMCNPPTQEANRLVVRVNGSDWNPAGGFDVIQPAHDLRGIGNNTGQSNLSASITMPLNTNDYVELWARAGTNVGPIYFGHSWMSMVKVS